MLSDLRQILHVRRTDVHHSMVRQQMCSANYTLHVRRTNYGGISVPSGHPA